MTCVDQTDGGMAQIRRETADMFTAQEAVGKNGILNEPTTLWGVD